MKPAVGDRVVVSTIRTTRRIDGSAPEATVTELDPGGVHVQFDEPVNGVMTAYATYTECIVIDISGRKHDA